MKSQVWKLWLAADILGLVLVGTALGQGPPFNAPNRMVFWTEGGNPVLVAELQINFTLHDAYVYITWAYSDGTTTTDIWYFEQTLNAGDTIPLYAPRCHINPWASVTGISSWRAYDYSSGTGRCTYNQLIIQARQWIPDWRRGGPMVSGVVRNTGGISTPYVVFAALYDANNSILDVNWSSKEWVDAGDTDGFTIGFGRPMPGVPGRVVAFNTWVFQGQWGGSMLGPYSPTSLCQARGLVSGMFALAHEPGLVKGAGMVLISLPFYSNQA
jgi:hypothetical protein